MQSLIPWCKVANPREDLREGRPLDTSEFAVPLGCPPVGKAVQDQLHQAMLLFTAGRGQALKRLLVDDGMGTNPQFWTLAQALSALYPAHTNEKRWVDGVLARKKGLGF